MNKRIVKSIILMALIIAAIYSTYNYSINKKNKMESNEKLTQVVLDNDGSPLLNESGEKVRYGAAKGDMVYDYELKDIQTGETIKISDYRGKKVFLNFWASWCPPCKAEAPHLQSVEEDNDEIVILGINVNDVEHTKGAEHAFVEEHGITFVNAYAPDEMYNIFPIVSFPTSLFINSEGIIEEGVVGPLNKETIESKFNKIK